jgi:hypothetical protein
MGFTHFQGLNPTAFKVSPVDVATSTVTITEAAHAGKTVTLSRLAGVAVTLPSATGTGNVYRFVVPTTITSNTHVIQVPAASTDLMLGQILVANNAGTGTLIWCAPIGSTYDTITLNGGTQGGIAGDWIELQDIATGKWEVSGCVKQASTEATPFSSAV